MAVAVCIHTIDHNTDLVYTGTGSIRALIDTTQDSIGNRSIYICHMQELASLYVQYSVPHRQSEATYD